MNRQTSGKKEIAWNLQSDLQLDSLVPSALEGFFGSELLGCASSSFLSRCVFLGVSHSLETSKNESILFMLVIEAWRAMITIQDGDDHMAACP